jgi:glycosyltransferase involved in cell wall biosynthesis
MPLDLTIVIPVRNEEKNLPGCLEAVGHNLARRVVVIDSGSTDRTREITLQHKAEFVDFVWNGKFPKKRNWFLRNHVLDTKWVMFLDADEYLTEDFKKELRENLSRDNKAGYWLKYTIYFMGKKLKGGYPLKKLALFQVGAGEYEEVKEDRWSNLDMEVHEHPILKGETGLIKSKIDHHDFRGITHYVNKHSEYAAWEAQRFVKLARDVQVTAEWSWKQRAKYYLMRSVLIGPVFFFGSFFLLGGFRDGVRGLAFAILKMSYFNQVYCKIRELNEKAK